MSDDTDRLAGLLPIFKAAWPHVASFVGSVMSLSFVERLTNRGKMVAVAVGFFTAEVVGPITHALVEHFAPYLSAEVVAPGLNFLLGLSAMAIIPPALKAIGAAAGDPAWVSSLIKKVTP